MLSLNEKPQIGLLITALLEDDWNQTGYLRPVAQAAVQGFIDALQEIAQVACPGLVETEEQAVAADLYFRRENVDAVVFVELAYTQSLIAMKALERIQVPVVVWNTQQLRSWPQDANWDIVMLNSGLAGLPETTHAMVRTGRRFFMVTGHMKDPLRLKHLETYLRLAAIAQRLRNTKMGMIGHPYQYMADLMVDPFSLRNTVGPTLMHIEPEELAAEVEVVTVQAAQALMEETRLNWRTDELARDNFERSARIALGLENLVAKRKIDALAVYDQAILADKRCGLVPSWGNSRLIAKGIPVTAEADINAATAMLILQGIAGDATFVENYGMDFDAGAAYIAHDSMGNPNLAAPEPRIALKPSIYYQGIYGWGAALEFAYRPGPVTFLALVAMQHGRWKMIVGEGHALPVLPRPTVAPQMLFRPAASPLEDFYDRWCLAGAGHHSALAYGHLGSELEILSRMMNVDFEIIR
jgi:L-arabinose isomerase